jgi:hypothetical protein
MARRVVKQKKVVQESVVVESIPVVDLKVPELVGFRCSKCGEFHKTKPVVMVYTGITGHAMASGSCACGSMDFKEECDA